MCVTLKILKCLKSYVKVLKVTQRANGGSPTEGEFLVRAGQTVIQLIKDGARECNLNRQICCT